VRGALDRARGPFVLLIAPALVLCAVYWGEVAANLGDFARTTYTNADAAAGPVISGTLHGFGHDHATLGNLAWFTSLWFGLAIRGLSFHRELWIVVPYAVVLATAGLVCWGVFRVAGGHAALVATVPMLCLSPVALYWSSNLVSHSPTWLAMAMLGVYATTLVPGQPAAPRARRGVLVAALVALVAGTNAASDYLLFACGIVPLGLAGVAVWLSSPAAASRLAAARAIAVSLGAAAIAAATTVIMHGLHVHSGNKTGGPSILNPSKIEGNLKVLWRIFLGLGDVKATRPGFQPAAALRVLCLIAAIAAVAAAVAVVLRTVVAIRTPDRYPPGRLPWVVFWTSGTLLLLAAYLVNGYATLEPQFEALRYFVGAVYCGAALAPLALTRARVPLYGAAAAGVTAIALASTIVIAKVGISQACCAELETGAPSPTLANRVSAIAGREGMKRGYAGYWYALGLSWFAKDRFRAYPVDRCGEHLKRLCPSFYNHLSSWYEPNRARRSFFLSSGDRLPRSAKSFGRPVRTYRFSGLRSDLKLYVYDYDIATRIGPR